MSIEKMIERIAVAGERSADALERIAVANEAAQGVFTSAKAEVELAREPIPEKEPTYAEKRKAEVAAAAKAEKEAKEAEKKPRGRPPGSTKKVDAVVVTPPADEEDPFATAPAEEPVPKATIEDVRSTLVDLRTFLVKKHGDAAGKEKAYVVLREFGGGASYLPGSKAGGAAPGGAGELKEAFYGTLVQESKKLIAAG